MSHLIPTASGNMSALANYNRSSNTPSLHASTNITVNTGNFDTAVFTAPTATDDATAVSFMLVNYSGAGTLTVELQEYDGVSAWVTKATGSKAFADMSINGENTIRLSSPYTYTTVTAGYYRYRFSQSGGTSITLAADSGGSNIGYIAWDDRTPASLAGYNIHLIAPTASTMQITVDGTNTFGAGDAAAERLEYRTWEAALYIGSYAKLINDPLGNSKLEANGHVLTVTGGSRVIDVSDDPTHTMELEIDYDTAKADFGDIALGNPTEYKHNGWEPTNIRGNYASGDGTTGNELTCSADISDWPVGWRVEISSTNTYGEVETKYIKSNTGGALVLSDTPGGAESGLTYAKTTRAWIVLMDSNWITSAKDSTKGPFFYNGITTDDDTAHWDHYHKFINPADGAVSGRRGIQYGTAAGSYLDFQYPVILDGSGTFSGLWHQSQKWAQDVYGVRQSNCGYFYSSCLNKDYYDCYVSKATYSGLDLLFNSNVNFYNLVVNGCNTVNAGGHGAIYGGTSAANFYNCDFQANRVNVVAVNSAKFRFVNCYVGDVYTETNITYIATDTDNYVVYDSCYFDATKEKYGGFPTNMVEGSRIAYHRFNNTDYAMFTRLAGAKCECTGAGLTDTTTTPGGNRCLKMEVDNDDAGGIFSFKTPSFVGYSGSALLYAKKNTQMASEELRLEVWLPQSTTPDETSYAPSNENWNVLSVGQAFTGGMGQFSEIKVVGSTVAAGAACYIGDIYNGSDDMNSLAFWEDGMPASVMVQQAGNPEAPLNVQTSVLTTDGTVGKLLTKLLSIAKFLGLK